MVLGLGVAVWQGLREALGADRFQQGQPVVSAEDGGEYRYNLHYCWRTRSSRTPEAESLSYDTCLLVHLVGTSGFLMLPFGFCLSEFSLESRGLVDPWVSCGMPRERRIIKLQL